MKCVFVCALAGEVAKCVRTGRSPETGKEQEACTPSASPTSSATGSGPTTFWPLRQYVHGSEQAGSVLNAQTRDRMSVFQRHGAAESKENQIRLKSLLSKNALRFALKAGETLLEQELLAFMVSVTILDVLSMYFWCLCEYQQAALLLATSLPSDRC